MPPPHLLFQRACDRLGVQRLALFADDDLEREVEQQVAELVAQGCSSVVLQGLIELEHFLDQVGAECLRRLRAVPGAAGSQVAHQREGAGEGGVGHGTLEFNPFFALHLHITARSFRAPVNASPSGRDARAWVEVDLAAVVENARTVARVAGTRLLPVVKANAYGVGAVAVSQALEALDPWGYGVATIEEGAELRAAGITRPVLVFTPARNDLFDGYREQRLTPALGDGRTVADWIARGARGGGIPPRDRYRDGSLRRALGRSRAARRPPRHAVSRGLLHPVPLGRAQRWLRRAAARAFPAGGGATGAAAGAAARRQQRRGAEGRQLRIRRRAPRRLSVRRLARRRAAGREAGGERARAGGGGAPRARRRQRQLQRVVDRGARHDHRDARDRLRRGFAALARRVGPGAGAMARAALPEHRPRDDVSEEAGRAGRARHRGGRSDSRRLGRRGGRRNHAGAIRGLEWRAAARVLDRTRAPAAAHLPVRRAAIIVLDGVGIGPAPDTAAYGDAGSDTLGNVARAVGGLRLPNLERLGLGLCRPLRGLSGSIRPSAAYGVALPKSHGKDSTTGHWEICGVLLDKPFRTYPDGFPTALLDEFARRTGRGYLGNRAASGTAIIAELGEEHQRTGKWIVYTSADSVFQVAAHEETVPLAELYRACEVARGMLVGEHAVSRVIARPFAGQPGAYERTPRRRDLSIEPVGPTLLDRSEEHTSELQSRL